MRMPRPSLCCALACKSAMVAMVTIASARGWAAQRSLAETVNTLRGTDSTPAFSRGNTFPAVAVPWGFNFWTPVTEVNSERWLYNYRSKRLTGFAVSHEPSPWIGEHGSVQVMPLFGKLRVDAQERWASFSHTTEEARPHYYRALLESEGIVTEFTPTEHASRWRFTFHRQGCSYLVFSSVDTAPGSVFVDSDTQSVSGYVDQRGPRLYFVAQLGRSWSAAEVRKRDNVSAWLKFDVGAGEQIEMAMATSFISIEQARRNLQAEVGSRSFDQVKAAAQGAWDKFLGKVTLQGATQEQAVTFYSNLYRVGLYPNSAWEDVGGHARHYSPYTQQVRDGKIYVNNGFWDTYRAEWPLLSLVAPEQAGEMLDGFVAAFKDGGWVPRWSGPGYIDCMVGSNSDITFADSYIRRVRGFDVEAAYRAMLKNALVYSNNPSQGRKGNDRSIFMPYVPADHLPESLAWTIEDTINDFGIAQLAKALGDPVHFEYFLNRAARYTALYSPSVGFFRGKKRDGNWRTPDSKFHPDEWGHEFTEGNAWHYRAAATIDPQGMANLVGGRAEWAKRLSAIFRAPASFRVGSYGQPIHEMLEAQATHLGQYAHSNEPLHSLIYMFDYAGLPANSQRYSRRVLERLYDSGVGTGRGYLGDEDNGQMSAWYVFSALGFYPASPGHAEYALGSPLFTSATVSLSNGKQFTISAPGNSATNIYIQSATLNGVPFTKTYLTQDQILSGGELMLQMGPRPSQWGTSPDDVPSSMTPRASADAPQFRPDAAVGGVVEASSDRPNHAASAAFDDNGLTEWQSQQLPASLTYAFGAAQVHAVSLYTLTSGAHSPESDPSDWRLEASDDCRNWRLVDRRSNQLFTERRQTRVFAAVNYGPFACYRLVIERAQGATSTQLAEVELIPDAPAERVPAMTGSAHRQ